jgi:hypothetical protein
VLSPVKFFFGNTIPTLLADGQFLSFKENVEFDVFAFALVLPRVFTMFQPCEPPVLSSISIVSENCF